MSTQGNAIVGQSGGPTCVINESLVGVVRELKRRREVKGIFGALHGIQGVLKQEIVDLRRESDRTLKAVASTPSAALGSVRKKPTQEECAEIFRILKAHDVRYFFYIGGNDSAETASILNGLAESGGYDLHVCHIPKTIDNDLLVTDHCPGFGSAARFVALAHMGDDLDNRALKGVKINVIMGRHAGFLTAAAGIARKGEDEGPHLIYFPEVPFSVDAFCGDVDACMKKWGRCVVAASEGLADASHNPIATTGEKDSHGNVQLSGTGALGDFLVGVIKERLKLSRVRADTFGYLQRSFPLSISPVDAKEAREVGAFGVRALTREGIKGGSVAIRRVTGKKAGAAGYKAEYFITDLKNVAKNTRPLDDAFIDSSRHDITDAFRKYALPLVGKLPEPGRLVGRRIPSRTL